VVHGLVAELFVLGVVVADAAVLEFGHGWGLEGLDEGLLWAGGPLRRKERCFA
jgi:hypothetical protein